MRPTALARRYAHAAFEVAREDGNPQEWLQELRSVAQALADEELRAALKNPAIPQAQKMEVIERLFPQLKPEVLNLLRLLLLRRRIDMLPAVVTAFEEELNAYLGRTEVEVVSARPLSPEEIDLIRDRLRNLTDRAVDLRTSVNPSLIGGIIIRLGDQLIDASVATRLERLRQQLT
jgi:F-type H+-transporting ATPase subunit delta